MTIEPKLYSTNFNDLSIILLEDNVPGASIHFSDWGGGARVRKISNIRRAQVAQSAPQNWKLCMFSSNFYVKFNGFVVPESAL